MNDERNITGGFDLERLIAGAPDPVQEEEPDISGAPPLDDAAHTAPESRIKYFRENLYPHAHRMKEGEYHLFIQQVPILEKMLVDKGEGPRGRCRARSFDSGVIG
ncbi:MAG: hypothetical protein OXC95_14860 [Dehalococcoidia bacterium]|nr:hypothetical protein [Dehalococcoidia bacterium]